MTRKRIILFLVAILIIMSALGGTFVWGVKIGREFPKTIVIEGVSNITPQEPINANFDIFWQAWDLINDYYLRNKEVGDQDKVYGAIRGLVGSLQDPNSEFFNPQDNKKFQEDIQGNFGGIGAEIGIRKGQLVIVAPLKDTPASRAGLRAGDQILKINSTSTADLTVHKAVTIIRGPAGTQVTLTIMRDDWEKPKEIPITRAIIAVPTLDFEMKGNVAYVKLYSFNANSNPLLYDAMVKAKIAGARGMILDLRNNPGGYLNVAIDISGWFFRRGTLVVSEVGINDSKKDFYANGNAALSDSPLVVLINGGSASASEILAGALHDNRGVKLVGEKSFGKGTVQQLENLADNSSLKITIAHWVLPSGKILEGEGLVPDIEVKMTDEDIETGRDPQLEKALEILRTELATRNAQ